MEIFRDIPGYENYQVSNYGRIFSKHKNEIKTLEVNKRGYFTIRPYKNNIRKTFRIHRLVGELFVDNPNNKPQINHIDGNKQNNHYTNLEWVTNRENQIHASQNGLIAGGRTSKYVGVHWDKSRSKWCARIKIGNYHKYLGRFKNEKYASIAYQIALIKLNNG